MARSVRVHRPRPSKGPSVESYDPSPITGMPYYIGRDPIMFLPKVKRLHLADSRAELEIVCVCWKRCDITHTTISDGGTKNRQEGRVKNKGSCYDRHDCRYDSIRSVGSFGASRLIEICDDLCPLSGSLSESVLG
ncbi:Uncharacterised protein r2_g3640 [Pycnogonum litorale]